MTREFESDLFGYPASPGYVRGSDTSRAAARKINPSSLRGKVLLYVQACGKAGATCDQCEVAMGGRHQTISARLRELVLMGFVEDTGRRRPTRSGHMAAVYVVKT